MGKVKCTRAFKRVLGEKYIAALMPMVWTACERENFVPEVQAMRRRVEALVASGVGRPFAPAGRVFKGWVAVPTPDRALWASLLREGVAFVAPKG